MIIVKKTRYLIFKNLKFRCSVGKAGIKNKKKEGDNITPKGIFKLLKLYYRADKIKKIETELKKIKIKKNMGWCDDPKSRHYNKVIKIPNNFSYEKLYRNDNIYDLIIVLSYNISPTIKNKGSAIFIHIAKDKYLPTQGCIALKKIHLIKILKEIKLNTLIKIN
jgi:L,D-peptidoglycan transpeptidase YkuD (ErfK/YbiS/YcfS/YnhG family)